MQCVMERLYDTVCRNPNTGEGGVTPTESEFHAPAFSRKDSVRMGNTVKGGSDRLVEIDYQGTIEYKADGNKTRRRSVHKLLMRIGYFAGDNHNITNMVIGADDKLLGTYLQNVDNIVGSCSGLCIEKIDVNSEVIKLDSQRYELQMTLRVQVR